MTKEDYLVVSSACIVARGLIQRAIGAPRKVAFARINDVFELCGSTLPNPKPDDFSFWGVQVSLARIRLATYGVIAGEIKPKLYRWYDGSEMKRKLLLVPEEATIWDDLKRLGLVNGRNDSKSGAL